MNLRQSIREPERARQPVPVMSRERVSRGLCERRVGHGLGDFLGGRQLVDRVDGVSRREAAWKRHLVEFMHRVGGARNAEDLGYFTLTELRESSCFPEFTVHG